MRAKLRRKSPVKLSAKSKVKTLEKAVFDAAILATDAQEDLGVDLSNLYEAFAGSIGEFWEPMQGFGSREEYLTGVEEEILLPALEKLVILQAALLRAQEGIDFLRQGHPDEYGDWD